MVKYVIQRVILAFITLFIILSLTFILMKTLPLDFPAGADIATKLKFLTSQAARGYLIQSTTELTELGNPVATVTPFQSTTTYYFYAEPILKQYGAWLTDIFTKWNWGTSYVVEPNVDSLVVIAKGLPTTVKVNVLSVIIAVPLGILLGVWAALKKNKPTDTIISTVVMILISVPSFVLITFLVLIFGYGLKWLPTEWPKSYYDLDVKVLGYIIPVFSLSLGSICGYCRFTRAELCDVLSSDYLLLARTKGLTKTQAVLRHAMRNAMVPILPSILAEIVGVLGGSMILEKIYNIPGIGNIFFQALSIKDYNLLMVDMAVFTLIGLLAGIILDLSYGFLDPRIRMGAKK